MSKFGGGSVPGIIAGCHHLHGGFIGISIALVGAKVMKMPTTGALVAAASSPSTAAAVATRVQRLMDRSPTQNHRALEKVAATIPGVDGGEVLCAQDGYGFYATCTSGGSADDGSALA